TAGSCAGRASSSRGAAYGCGCSTDASTAAWNAPPRMRRIMPPKREAKAADGLEARLARLDAIVAALERDDLELEQALALFEEGVQHIRHARELLQRAELRVEQLLAEEDGTVVLEPMERDEP